LDNDLLNETIGINRHLDGSFIRFHSQDILTGSYILSGSNKDCGHCDGIDPFPQGWQTEFHASPLRVEQRNSNLRPIEGTNHL
jgi:hypothetical protein